MVKQILQSLKHLHSYPSTVGIGYRILLQPSNGPPHKGDAFSLTDFPQIARLPETYHIQLMQDVNALISAYFFRYLRCPALPFFIMEIEPPVSLVPAYSPHTFGYGIPMPMYR